MTSNVSVIIIADYLLRGNISLLNINNYTLLQRQIKTIRSVYKDAEIVVVAHYECDTIIKQYWHKYKNVRFVYNQQDDTANDIHNIHLGLINCYHKNVIIIPGNILFSPSAISQFIPNQCAVVATDKYPKIGHWVGINHQNNKVVRFAYDLPCMWSGIAYLTEKECLSLLHDPHNYDYNPFLFHEILQQLISDKHSIHVINNKRMKFNRLKYYKELKIARNIWK